MNSTNGKRRQKKSELTRQRILQAARRLFNDRGTSSVSTNHIAAATGISPGNLYYHFRDKHDIIRALHAQYAAAHEDRWEPSPDPGQNLARLGENLTAGMELAFQYRFFEREILALLRADPKLRAAYREFYQRRLAQWVAFGEHLVAQGVLRPPRPPRTIGDLAVAIWLIAESWIGFLDLTGDPQDPRQVARGADLVLVALDPYLTAKGRRVLAAAAPRAASPKEPAK
jgi:AcrR family transcriptional regulator